MSREFKVGLLAIVSGTILYIGFNFLKGIDLFSTTNKYYAYYDNIDGLSVSNPVTLNGFTIGRVSEIEIVQEKSNQVKVEFGINANIFIGKSSSAMLTTDLLGSKSVVLEVVDGDERLEDGGVLKGSLDQGIMGSLLESTDPFKAAGIKVNRLLDGFEGTRIKLDSALVSVGNLSNNFSGLVKDNKRSLKKSIDDLSETLAALNDEQDGIKPALAGFNTFADSLQAIKLNELVGNLNTTLSTLQSTLKKVSEGDGSMAKLMNNDSLYQNLNNTARDLDLLLIDFKENPKRYVNFSVFGRKDK